MQGFPADFPTPYQRPVALHRICAIPSPAVSKDTFGAAGLQHRLPCVVRMQHQKGADIPL